MNAVTLSAGAVAADPPCGRRRTHGISQLFVRHAVDRGLGGGRMCSSAPPPRPWSCTRYRTFMDIDIFMAICRTFLQRNIKLRILMHNECKFD